MVYNFDYKTIMDAFTAAASQGVAEAAFDAVRDPLKNGHPVRISLADGQQPVSFTQIDDFEQWVHDSFY